MKAILEEVMLSAAPLLPVWEDSLVHRAEACWRCDEVRSISLEDLARSF